MDGVTVDNLEAFGQRVRDRRQLLGLSVRALAARAGISPAYVTSIERGHNSSTGRPPLPSVQVVASLAAQLDFDPSSLVGALGAHAGPADSGHVLLYCLDQTPVLPAVDRAFGAEVDHWLYIADPRSPGNVDDLESERATIVRWELGAFPYQTHRLEPNDLISALNTAARACSATHAGQRVGLVIADCSAVMRWVQNPDSEVTLERTWHDHVHAIWADHFHTPPARDVCVYHHEDIHALGLTIDHLTTALTLIGEHHHVYVLQDATLIGGPTAVARILRQAQPVGVSPDAWIQLVDAAADTLARPHAHQN